jgi:hypothetical protein
MVPMPDTPGKRQRDAVKAKRRQVKEERRAARKSAREDPMPPADEEVEDHDRTDVGGRAEDEGEPGPPGEPLRESG